MDPLAIHACNPGPMTGDGNWTWLLRGAVPTLIDAGTGDTRHIAGLDEALAGARLARVLVTHAHTDHASGAPALAARDVETQFLKRPWPERDARWPARWEGIEYGAVVAAGETHLVAIHTPGHAPDHLCFWHEASRTLFGGDLVLKGTTVYIPTSLGGDLAAYLGSLERVLSLRPARILPAHGPVIDDPEALIRKYIDHRLEREAQVLAAVASGPVLADDIVTQIYRVLPARMHPLARESVLAHLIKLEAEGRVARAADGNPADAATRWHRINP